MVYQVVVLRSVLSLKFLFNSGELAERRRNKADYNTGYNVPGENQSRSLWPDQLRQLSREEDYIEDRLREIQVERGQCV
jgi:hypothetical protein